MTYNWNELNFSELRDEDNVQEQNPVTSRENQVDNIPSRSTASLAEFLPESELVPLSSEPESRDDERMFTPEPVTEKPAEEDENTAAMVKSHGSEEGIFAIMYSACKKAAIVGSIYLVGYMGWSVAWLIAPLIFSVARNHYAKSTAHKRNIAKASAIASEKEVILARIDDLPAWVGERILRLSQC